MNNIELMHGDCLELMKSIPDKSVDLVLTDPPYNIKKNKEWDSWKTKEHYVAFMGDVFLEAQRVLNGTRRSNQNLSRTACRFAANKVNLVEP